MRSSGSGWHGFGGEDRCDDYGAVPDSPESVCRRFRSSTRTSSLRRGRGVSSMARRAEALLGSYWSATEGRHVIYESRLGLGGLLFADFDRSVRRICAQPFLVVTRSHGRMMKVVP